jgi:hypothetical protein
VHLDAPHLKKSKIELNRAIHILWSNIELYRRFAATHPRAPTSRLSLKLTDLPLLLKDVPLSTFVSVESRRKGNPPKISAIRVPCTQRLTPTTASVEILTAPAELTLLVAITVLHRSRSLAAEPLHR